MNRRNFFAVPAAMMAMDIRPHIILDYKTRFGPLEKEFLYGRVLVDGKEIQQVWYVNTRTGVVKTYDVNDSHKPVAAPCGTKALSRTVTGKIELFRKDGSRL